MKKQVMNCFSSTCLVSEKQASKQNEFICQNPNYPPSFTNLRESSLI